MLLLLFFFSPQEWPFNFFSAVASRSAATFFLLVLEHESVWDIKHAAIQPLTMMNCCRLRAERYFWVDTDADQCTAIQVVVTYSTIPSSWTSTLDFNKTRLYFLTKRNNRAFFHSFYDSISINWRCTVHISTTGWLCYLTASELVLLQFKQCLPLFGRCQSIDRVPCHTLQLRGHLI